MLASVSRLDRGWWLLKRVFPYGKALVVVPSIVQNLVLVFSSRSWNLFEHPELTRSSVYAVCVYIFSVLKVINM